MSTHKSGITVHAGRALLEETKRFSNEGKAVGEYVKNSWQYTDHDPTVEITVDNDNKSIRIKDNSRGMDLETIGRFMVLHAPNIERVKGKFGRGEYGTGKIAGLGIGESLSVRTVRNGKLNFFEIHRKDCDSKISEKEVAVRWEEKSKPTKEANGTIIDIKKFRHKRAISVSQIKDYLQGKTLTETVYDHKINLYLQEGKLEKKDIPHDPAKTKKIKPSSEQKEIFVDAELIIKVAERKLNPEERGIKIFSKGIYKAFVNNPSAKKSDFIFGECSCDRITDENLDVPIFDSSRREEMNEDSPIAQKLKEFISYHVDVLRKELEKEDNDRRKKEKDENLKKEAEKMKEFFNKAFREHEIEFQKRTTKARGTIDKKDDFVPELGETKIVIGKDFNVNVVEGDEGAGIFDGPGGGEGGSGEGSKAGGKLERTAETTDNTGKEKKSKRRKSGGGFNFEFEYEGAAGHRARYEDTTRTIIINLSHPFIQQIDKLTGGDRTTKFMRACYEAAAFEFAVAVTMKKGNSNVIVNELLEGVIEMQDIVDDMYKKIATLNLFDD